MIAAIVAAVLNISSPCKIEGLTISDPTAEAAVETTVVTPVAEAVTAQVLKHISQSPISRTGR